MFDRKLLNNIHKSDFSNEEEYRQALINTYKELKMENYEVLCASNSYEMYLNTCDGMTRDGNESNRPMSKKNMGLIVERDDSVHNWDNSDIQQMGEVSCCSKTAMQTIECTWNQMGYNTFSDIHKKGNDYSARYCHQGICNGKRAIYGAGYDATTKTNPKKTVVQLIDEGILGAGDVVSYHNHDTGSKYHAVTICQVDKDENGKVKGYVVQQNNASVETKLQYFPINRDKNGNVMATPNPFRNGAYGDNAKYEFVATPFNAMMKEQINKDVETISKLSTEELEQKVIEAQASCTVALDKLVDVEKRLMEKPEQGSWRAANPNSQNMNWANMYHCPREMSVDYQMTKDALMANSLTQRLDTISLTQMYAQEIINMKEKEAERKERYSEVFKPVGVETGFDLNIMIREGKYGR